MTSRQIRRAAERTERKLARKAGRQTAAVQQVPLPPAIPEATAAAKPSRAEINRANALHSSGPVTPEGKMASSRNSLRHGLASGELILHGEDPAGFEDLLSALLADHQPANTTEEMLVHQMAQSHWLTQRALRLQNQCFTIDGVDEKRLALFIRYQTTHERAFHRALNTLIRLQKDRRRYETGFVSQKRPAAGQTIGFVSQNDAHAPQAPQILGPESGQEHLEAARAA